jgi:predicted ferric reductase
MHLRSWHVIVVAVLACAALVAPVLPSATYLTMGTASLVSGAVALSLMAFGPVLAARWPPVESAFGGLDRIYLAHKWLGIWALTFASFHLLFKAGASGWDTAAIFALPGGWGRFVRQLSFVGLMVIVLLALNRNIPYGIWRWWHKLSGPIFIVVVLHWLSIKQPLPLGSPAGLWLAIVSALGIVAALYKLLLYPFLARHAEYRVVAINPGAASMHLQLEPVTKGVDFRPGQFGFLRMKEDGLREPHPFTIASGGGGEGRVDFVIRNLGDFTGKLIASTRVGMGADIYAPYGRFARRTDAGREAWIAGGVGISPFIAWLQDEHAQGLERVTLFYFYTPGREFPSATVLETMARTRGAEFVPVPHGPADPAFVGRFTALCHAGDPRALDVAFCGPRGLLAAVRKLLQANDVPQENLRYELFEFR